MAITTPQARHTQAAAQRGRAHFVLPRRASFWLVGTILGVLMFAASAPSPLYSVYQERWHFSATTLTAVFAVYALALLGTLLVSGALSDHVGRRPVILAGLLIDAGAMICFLLANGVGALYAARMLQGIATGAATSALSAALIELQPENGTLLGPLVNSSAPAIGLGVGALGTSLLVQYAPAPTRLIFWLLLAALLLAALAVVATREPGKRRPGVLASLRPRIGVPPAARGAFAATLPCLVALVARSALPLLGPSLASAVIGSHDHLWGGATICLLMGAAATASIALRGWPAQRAMLAGSATLLGGIAITIPAIAATLPVPFVVGTAVAGFGFGLAFLGVFRTLTALAPASDRAALIAAIYTVSYLAFSVPVVLAGLAATHYGLHATSLAYSGAVAGLVLIAVASFALRGALRAQQTHPVRFELPPCPGTTPDAKLILNTDQQR